MCILYSGLQYAIYIFVCEKVCEIMCEWEREHFREWEYKLVTLKACVNIKRVVISVCQFVCMPGCLKFWQGNFVEPRNCFFCFIWFFLISRQSWVSKLMFYKWPNKLIYASRFIYKFSLFNVIYITIINRSSYYAL